MTDQPEESKKTATAEPATFAFDAVDTWKLKAPSFVALLPPEFFPTIGRVATSWGTFETLFENLLIALLKASGNTDDKWRGLTFRKRRTLFRERMGQILGQCPTALASLDAALTGSETLYIKRNLAVHGRMQSKFSVSMRDGRNVTEIKLLCAGRYNGKEIREEFTADQLDDLYYEIVHICGLINAVSMAQLGIPPTSPEIPILQAFLSNNHPTYPNPATLAPPPQS